jgi:steroid 5-alpha reductase family enzyme
MTFWWGCPKSIGLGLLALWVLAVTAMLAGWRWQRRHGKAGVVDVIWSAGIGVGAVFLAAVGDGARAPRLLLAVLGGAWSARLAAHLWTRLRREGEDGRYRHLRSLWHDSAWRWLAFFQFQALLVPVFALPFAAVAVNPLSSPRWLAAATALWVLGAGGETLADAQLARFRADPANRGRTCREGLWRYSRHPNYFFEWLHWFAYVALAAGSPLWALAWLGPLLMWVFLRFMSGVPWTEAQALRSRGEDYRDYQRRTPMLFPWFPRRSHPT